MYKELNCCCLVFIEICYFKSVAENEQHKSTKNYKLNSRELVRCTENIYNIKKKRINIIAKTIYKIMVIES